VVRLRGELEEKSHALDLIIPENEELRRAMKSLEEKLMAVELESKKLLDRWMSQKMVDAERLNEVNALLLSASFNGDQGGVWNLFSHPSNVHVYLIRILTEPD
jgi:hypothetical protein